MYFNPITKSIFKNYQENFGDNAIGVRSPGRVNIIGEHTDYNEGFVLPAAIDKATYISIGKSGNENIRLIAADYNESFETNLSSITPGKSWPNYILGVVDQMIKRGYILHGFNLFLQGDVPIGAGLSSSASVECATAYALNELFQLNISAIELIDIAQKAEHIFAGVQCGIMDQFVSILGKKDHVIKLDCRSLAYEYEPLELKDIKIVLLNTNVKHSLASSEYNTRHGQCIEGVALLKKNFPEIKSLRDATPAMLQQFIEPVDELIYRRCKYVVEENIRVLNACAHLQNGNIKALGKEMFDTHEGLSKEYEVSCRELDFLVDYIKNKPGVLGARMMGGGFGGCTINLIREEVIDDLLADVSEAYQINMNKDLTSYIAVTEDGTSMIH